MKTAFTIKIKKKTQSGWLICLLIVVPFLFGTLNDLLGLPRMIRYILDFVWLALLLLIWRFCHPFQSKVKDLCVWVVLFLAYTVSTYLVQYQSVLYYLWGVRNNFRFYAAFLAFATFLTLADAELYLKLFDKLFWINVAVSLFQFFALGLAGDYLGGIFGAEKGTNGYTNIFFVIILTKTLVFYLEKKETIWTCASQFVAAMVIAAMAELKFFFIETLLIIALAILLTNFTWRKFWVIVGGFLVVLAGALLLSYIFPNFAGWFSVKDIIKAALSDRGYTASGDLNRLNAIPRINKLWLTEWGEQVFGLGLGNCDTSSVSFLNTPFFKKYERMHYSWISYAQMYLECGWVGLVFYFGFFVLLYARANKIRKKGDGMINIYSRMAMILSIVCVVISVYNSSLRTEAGYMMYFTLALPFIKNRDTRKEKAVHISR